MNALEGIIEELNNQDIQFIQDQVIRILNEDFKVMENFIARLNKGIKNYEETGVKPNFNFNILELSEEIDQIKLDDNSNKRISLKENVKPAENILTVSSSLKNRPRRNAFKEATQNINVQSNIKKTDSIAENVIVKKEKISMANSEQNSELLLTAIKTEKEEMPAPKQRAPRTKKQKKTLSKLQIKEEKIDEEATEVMQQDSQDSSDVVLIENKTITTINLIDSDDIDKTLKNEDPVERSRSKRTKKKRTRTSSGEKDEESADKRSRGDPQPDPQTNVTPETDFEDAVSNLEDHKENNNATFVSENPQSKNVAPLPVIMDTTVVLNKAAPLTADDLLTDDESEDEKRVKQPPKTLTKTVTKSSKQVFSPFEPSPVKKKVQAFERLREETNAIPVRITRTKTKAQAKEQEEENAEVDPKNTVKEKAKLFTPMNSKFIPSAASTTLKTSKLTTPSSSNESMSSKLASSLKASRYEYKERERIRKEQENEALKKREAFLQAQIEEKKRKREEKQLRAQQQREALEKEKLKSLEIQRLKEERHRQIVAEQEERKQKQKEEQDKKRLMAKMRAIEEKKKEEQRRLEEQKKTAEITAKLAKQDEEMLKLVQKQKMERERQKKVPIYFEKKPPLLPTPDCYDSDEEDNTHGHKRPMTWDRMENLIELEIIMLSATDAVKNTFFSRQAQTPDLQDIFEVIDQRKLKRSSSAVWHKPPRYTMMPNIEEHDENNEFHTDDEDYD